MKSPLPFERLKTLRLELGELLQASSNALAGASLRKLNVEVRETIEELDGFLKGIDPIRQPSAVFDPSNPKIIGRFISLALVAQERLPLSTVPAVYGSGVYAIYYRGGFPTYAAFSGTETPLYVGQAAPSTQNARSATEQGARLSARLNEHRKNIEKATTTLKIEDFDYRSLVIQSGWETAAEDYLIHLFKPIWNSETSILFGLGKHGDSASTRGHPRSPWDTLHPGRPWAAGSESDAKSHERIHAEVAEHIGRHPIYPDLTSVLDSFVSELRQ